MFTRRRFLKSAALTGAGLTLAGHEMRPAQAQASPDAAPPHKSVYGKLASIDKVESGIVMKSDGGERLSWRFDARVIAAASRFKPSTGWGMTSPN